MFDNRDEIGVGMDFKNLKTNLFIKNALGEYSDLNTSAANISLYVKYKMMQFGFFGLDFGTRLNLATLSTNKGSAVLEPRLSFTLNPFDAVAIKGAWGLYQQELITVTDENEVINLYEGSIPNSKGEIPEGPGFEGSPGIKR